MLGKEAAKGWVDDIAFGWTDPEIPRYQVDKEKLKHLAIICDGNRRAALNMGYQAHLGHWAGMEVVEGVARAARAWDINTVTFWVWSTDNWKRDHKQVDFVMSLALENLAKEEFLEELVKSEARFTHLGRKDRLSPVLCLTLERLEKSTAHLNRFNLNLGLDYGGLDEIVRAYSRMMNSELEGSDLGYQSIYEYLDTANQPNVDLVVRTGVGGKELPHTSGFMPLQTANAAWIFLPDLFPNLTPPKLLETVKVFELYERRMGK